jgi:hypothetical protein
LTCLFSEMVRPDMCRAAVVDVGGAKVGSEEEEDAELASDGGCAEDEDANSIRFT